MKIKALGLSASPRHGNTEVMIKEALQAAQGLGAETEYVSFVGKEIKPCIACDKCKTDAKTCTISDDWQEINNKFRTSDCVIIGSPVYLGGVNAQLKAYMDRFYGESDARLNKENARPLVGGAIAVAGGRHGGQDDALHQIRVFFEKRGILPIGIRLPHKQMGATGHAYSKGDIVNDKWINWRGPPASSLQGASDLGKRVVLITKIVKAGMKATRISFEELIY